MTTVLDKHKLKRLLGAMRDQMHWSAVVARGAAMSAGEDVPVSIEQINAEFDEMDEMLDEAIYDEYEGEESS